MSGTLIFNCKKPYDRKGPENYNYIIIKYQLKICIKKECCKQCRHVKFKGIMTKWPEQKETHSTKNTQITKTNIIYFIIFYINIINHRVIQRDGYKHI